MSIELLLFDVGGVLVQTLDDSFRSRWEDRLHMPRGSLEPAVHDTSQFRQLEHNQITAEYFWLEIGRKLGIPVDEFEAFRSDFYAGDHLNEQLASHILRWREKCHIGIISNAPLTLRENLASRFGISNLFEQMIISSEVGVRKPHPRIYELALAAFNVQASRALFVDDVAANIHAAEALGMHGILYMHNQQTIRGINRLIPAP